MIFIRASAVPKLIEQKTAAAVAAAAAAAVAAVAAAAAASAAASHWSRECNQIGFFPQVSSINRVLRSINCEKSSTATVAVLGSNSAAVFGGAAPCLSKNSPETSTTTTAARHYYEATTENNESARGGQVVEWSCPLASSYAQVVNIDDCDKISSEHVERKSKKFRSRVSNL